MMFTSKQRSSILKVNLLISRKKRNTEILRASFSHPVQLVPTPVPEAREGKSQPPSAVYSDFRVAVISMVLPRGDVTSVVTFDNGKLKWVLED